MDEETIVAHSHKSAKTERVVKKQKLAHGKDKLSFAFQNQNADG